MSADGRFAPSPTGPLHLGSLRTALAAWLVARHGGGRWLVRIEDLDPGRSRAAWEREQLTDLEALGLGPDEPPVRQSERGELYGEALARLAAADLIYPCWCTRAEIRQAASAPHGDLPEGAYPGTCRRLTGAQRGARAATGRPAALRLDAGGARIAWNDLVLGPQTGAVDDFVVRRADGVAAYQLAVVVDDAAQGVDDVIRGADLADSTPRQILLQRLLGLPTPRYGHVGLVLGPDGARLAKRHGAATLADRREAPGRTLATLARSLGLTPAGETVADPAELLAGFAPATLPAGPVAL